MSAMTLAIIGTGYVGLVSAAGFAELGHKVVAFDIDKERIDRLNNGEVPIYEPGLADLVMRHQATGNLTFCDDIKQAITEQTEFVFIAVGTPPHPVTGHADLSQVYAASHTAACQIAELGGDDKRFIVLVTKSTVPVGTSEYIAKIAARHLGAERFSVASNPEFLREGAAIKDFLEPDRIVIGCASKRGRAMLEKLYQPLSDKNYQLVMTSAVATAELIKYAANAFLATKISFINEIARLCEAVDAEVEEVSYGIGLDERIGSRFLEPGPGFGGSCFPKDTLALIKTANDYGSPLEVIEAVVKSNDRHQHYMVKKMRDALGGSLSGKRIGVLGLAFKAGTDDVRGSPALPIISTMQNEGAIIVAYDPQANDNASEILIETGFSKESSDVFKRAHAVMILTEWPEFRELDWATLGADMRKRLVVDLRNLLDPAIMKAAGFKYYGLGR